MGDVSGGMWVYFAVACVFGVILAVAIVGIAAWVFL